MSDLILCVVVLYASFSFFFFLMIRRPPRSTRTDTLFPYTTLFRSFTLLLYPVQAGVSLHQAPFLIERGLDPNVAATVVSTFSLGSAVGSLCFGLGARRLGRRATLVRSEERRVGKECVSTCRSWWSQYH